MLFRNITWPINCVFNVFGEGNAKAGGSADVEVVKDKTMKVLYSRQDWPSDWKKHKSIFLVGPTPRSVECPSWRPNALKILEELQFDGYVLVPESASIMQEIVDEKEAFTSKDWLPQVFWEKEGLDNCTVIAAWVPRSKELPGFTTNVEFGRYVTSGRLLYGRPEGSWKSQYLDWLYYVEQEKIPHNTLENLMIAAINQTTQ